MKVVNCYNFLGEDSSAQSLKVKKNVFEKYVPAGELVKELHDVYVMSPTGLILDSNFNPIYSTANEIIYWVGKPKLFPDQVKEHGREFLRQKSVWLERAKAFLNSELELCKENIIESEDNTLIYASSATEKLVFGHFYDMVQRLFHVRQEEYQDIKLLVSDPARILEFDHFLSLLGFRNGYTVRPKKYSLLKVKKLIVPEMSIGPAGMTPAVQDWLFDKLILSNDAVDKSGKQTLKLYLDRSSVARENNRDFSNSEAVGEFLQKNGFVTHRNFKTLDEVLSAYYNAEIIVGAHGAAFINCIYCNSKARIFEFVASNRLVRALAKMPKKTREHWLIEMQADKNHSFHLDLATLSDLIAGTLEPSSLPGK